MTTNAEVAERLGCSKSMVSKMRTGHRRPSGDVLYRLVFEYKLDPESALYAYASAERFGSFIRDKVFTRARSRA